MSQCAAILEVLSDGEPHTVREIHERAGYSRLNSRVSELRTRGHNIVCRHVPGCRGTDAYEYRLATLDEQSALRPPVSPDGRGLLVERAAESRVPQAPGAAANLHAGTFGVGSSRHARQLDLFGAAA